MILSDGRHLWSFAIAGSLAVHALVLFFPTVLLHYQEPGPEQIMAVRLVLVPEQLNAVQSAEKPQTLSKSSFSPETKTLLKPLTKKVQHVKTELSEVAAGSGSTGQENNAGSFAANETSLSQTLSMGEKKQTDSRTVVEIGSLKITKKILPEYSSFSRKRNEEGTVSVIITVSNGIVTKAEIESSSGYQRLDASALRAVKQWLFNSQGTVRARVPVTFKLEK